MATSSSNAGPRSEGEVDSKFLVAVDFGTTFSGVAYANTLIPEKQTLVLLGDGFQGEKTPTVLKYDNGKATGHFRWGYDATRNLKLGERLHEWFKLGLCPELQARRATGWEFLERFPSMTALPPLKWEENKQLVIDYLGSVREYTETHLRKEFPEFSDIPRQYIITVPAMWTDKAKRATRDCATAAGMAHQPHELIIIAEPEAAGIYALTKMSRRLLNKDDTFIICDAGGGTVDLSSYEVKSLEPYIDLDCVSIPSGGLCGSSILNRLFLEYMEDKLNGYSHTTKQPKSYQRWLKMAVEEEFENKIKREFKGDDRADMYRIWAPGFPENRARGVWDEELHISVRDIREKVFDPVVAKIRGLVRDHIEATIEATGNAKAILLVGGFGRNMYLETQIREIAEPDTQVYTVDRLFDNSSATASSTAIVRGALIAGLAEMEQRRLDEQRRANTGKKLEEVEEDEGKILFRVSSRRAPRHYGVRGYEEYDPRNPIHAKGKHRIESVGGIDMIEVINWIVGMGEPIKKSRSFKLTYYKKAPLDASALCEVKSDIYASEEDDRPNYPHTKKHPNLSIAKPHVTVRMDLHDTSDLPTEKVKNVKYYNVPLLLYMTLTSGDPTFTLVRGEESEDQTMHKTYIPKSVSFGE